MVSAAELQAQQAQLRRTGVRVPLQVQQQALRRGVSPQQILIERERTRVEAEVTRQLKSQAATIEEQTLSRVGSIEQFNELFKQIPPEIQEFIKLTPQTIKQDLVKRVSSLKVSVSKKETEIKNLNQGRDEALREGNRAKADRFEAERRGVEKEVDFIRGTIPRLEAGEIIKTSVILDVAKDIGLAEEQKRKLTSEQVRDLTARLGTREEAREVLRTGKVTIEQAKRLGLELKEVRIPKEPDTLTAFRDPKTGEVILMSFLPGEAEKRGLVEIKVDAKTLLPTPEFEKPTFDIFGFKTEPTEFEKSLGLDFTKLAPLPEEKGIIEKVKEKVLERVRIEPIGIPIGFPSLITLETGVPFQEPTGLVFDIKPEIELAERVISFPARKVSEKRRKEEAELAEFGKREFIIGGITIDASRLTDKQIGILLKEKGVVEKITPLTEEEIKQLTFGGGLDIIEKRRIVDAEVKLENLAKQEFNKLAPSSNDKVDRKFKELQNKASEGKISVEDANIELKEFTDKINEENSKKVGNIIDKEADKLSEEISKEITEANKQNFIKRELALFGITVATGAVLGFGAVISPVIAGGLAVFGGVQVAKTVPVVVTAVKEGDIQTLGAIGISAGGFAIGGLIGAKFGTSFIQSTKIRPAIDRAQVETRIKAQNLDVIKRFRFPKQFELEMKTLLDKGFSIRVIETRLRATRVADAKFLPDVRGRFIEILTRDGRVIETISIGNVLAKTPKKIFSRDIISESVGKVTGEKSFISTRTIIGKLKGDKFISLQELVTFQETQITGRERIEPLKEQITAETTTFLVEKLTKRQLRRQKVFKPDEFGDILRTKKDLIGGNILAATRLTKQQLKLFLEQQRKTGRRISKTETIAFEKVTGFDITRDIRIKKDVIGEVVVKKNLGEILTGFKTTESKVQGFTVNIPEIKIKKVVRPPRKTLQEVFGTGTQVEKIRFKDFFKTKQGKDIIQQQKQINKNINKVIETGLPEVITKEVAKDIVKVDTRQALIFGRIPKLDLGEAFGDLGVLSTKLGVKTITGVKEEAKVKRKPIVETIDITRVIEDVGQIPLQIPLVSQPQLQTQRQLQQLKTSLAGFDIPQPIISPPDIKIKIPIVFDFKKKEKPRKILPPELDIGFDAFVKSKGKKIKVTKNPVIESSAKDIGSFLVDNTLSAEFSIKKSKKPPQQPKIQVPKNYWELNKSKFRQFRIKKGKPIPLKNTFIELKPQRLDTFGEVRKITAERLLVQRRGKKTNIDKVSRNLKKIFGF